MLKIKNLRGECQHCGGEIEFHAEHTGSVAECPHCGQQTELQLPAPKDETSPLRRKMIGFSIAVAIILIGGAVAVGVALKRAKRLANRQEATTAVPTPVNPLAAQEFSAGAMTIQRDAAGTLAFATGTLTNQSSRQRFGVRVEIELNGPDGTKLGSTGDYTKVIEPKGVWTFRALAADRRTASGKLVRVSESN